MEQRLIRPSVLTPIIHNNCLQRLEVSTHLITAELLRFIRLYLRNVTRLRIFGNPRFIGTVRDALTPLAPSIRSIRSVTYLQLSGIAQVSQFLPGLTLRFPQVRVAHILEGCTLLQRVLNFGAWHLDELQLNLGFAPLNTAEVMLSIITGGGQQRRLYLWQQTAPAERGFILVNGAAPYAYIIEIQANAINQLLVYHRQHNFRQWLRIDA